MLGLHFLDQDDLPDHFSEVAVVQILSEFSLSHLGQVQDVVHEKFEQLRASALNFKTLVKFFRNYLQFWCEVLLKLVILFAFVGGEVIVNNRFKLVVNLLLPDVLTLNGVTWISHLVRNG